MTTSDNKTMQLRPVTDDYPTYLQARIRSRTRLCLDPTFRQNTLGESAAEAEAKSRGCEQCVPVYFDHLENKPAWEWQSYVESWQVYKECLARALE